MASVPPESTPPPTTTTTTTTSEPKGVTIPTEVPFNPELGLFMFVWLVIALLWLLSDEVGAGSFATLTVALTFGYLVSRGIAKASRVEE
jgi:hypothetical protein